MIQILYYYSLMSIWVKQGTWHHMTPTQRTEPLISLKKTSSRNGGLIVIYHDRTREKKTPIYNLNKHKESLSLKMIHPELRCADFLEPMDTRLSIPPQRTLTLTPPWKRRMNLLGCQTRCERLSRIRKGLFGANKLLSKSFPKDDKP